jgi:hypothetical protein
VTDVALSRSLERSGPARWRALVRRWYFLAMSLLLVAHVLIGFARTLFFRPLFDVPRIPTYLFVHGAILSTWYVWLCLQSALVAAHRTDLHRRVGVVGVLVAAAVVAVSLVTVLNFIPRMRQTGVDVEAASVTLVQLVIASALALTAFTGLVTLAVVHRRRPPLHKRLMLFASIAIIGPAGSRMPATLGALGLSPAIALFFLVILLASPIVYDLVERGRPYPVTVICLILVIGSAPLSIAASHNETVRAFVLGLR